MSFDEKWMVVNTLPEYQSLTFCQILIHSIINSKKAISSQSQKKAHHQNKIITWEIVETGVRSISQNTYTWLLAILTWYRDTNGKFGSYASFMGANLSVNKGNNKITELRTILQRESQNSYLYKQTKSVNNRKTVKTVMTLTWYRHF